MKLSITSIACVGLAALACPQPAHATGSCQTAQPITTGTYPLVLYDYFVHPNNWDTSYEWFRVTLQPGDQLIAVVTDVVVQFGAVGS